MTRKLIKKYGLIVLSSIPYGDGEGGAGGSGEGGAGGSGEGGAGGSGEGGAGGSGEQMFTQDQLNTFLAEDRRKTEKRVRALQGELQQLREAGMTPEAQEAFNAKMENLRQQYLSNEQKAEEKLETQKKEAKQRITDLENEANDWKERYSNVVISDQLTKAAIASKAEVINPNLVVDLLKTNTTLEPVLDAEGNPTKELAPIVSMPGKDKDGKPTTLKLTPTEAVEKMATNTAEYGALFKSTQKGGLTTGKAGKAVIASGSDYDAIRDSGQHRQIGS